MNNKEAICKINIKNEYAELKSLVVGHADQNFRFPGKNEDLSADYMHDYGGGGFDYMDETSEKTSIFEDFNSKNYEKFPIELINEENVNLNNFANKLSDFGIKVYRPERRNLSSNNSDMDIDYSASQFWRTRTYMQGRCPRDLILIVENKVIICPTIFRGRRKEIEYFYSEILENIKNNCSDVEIIDLRQYSLLKDDVFKLDNYDDSNHCIVSEAEPIFDAASVLKISEKKLLYQISNFSNYKGLDLLQTILPDFEIIPLKNWYNGLHIDSTISILNNKCILFNPTRCTYDLCKQTFSKHGFIKFIACPDNVYDHGHKYISTSSKWIAMNLLVIDPELAIVDEKQTELMSILKSECNINSVPVHIPLGRDFGGGAHCITLDLERE